MPTVEAQSQALLAVYANVSASYGLRLYLPIKLLRKALRTHLANYHLRTLELDDILRRAQELLPDCIVSFAPFSGPSRGGLQVYTIPKEYVLRHSGCPYAGFLSGRPKQDQ